MYLLYGFLSRNKLFKNILNIKGPSTDYCSMPTKGILEEPVEDPYLAFLEVYRGRLRSDIGYRDEVHKPIILL